MSNSFIAAFRNTVTIVIKVPIRRVIGRAEAVGMNVIVDVDAVETRIIDDRCQHGGDTLDGGSAGDVVGLAGVQAGGCRRSVREQLVASQRSRKRIVEQ